MYEKLAKLVDRLYERTEANAVQWGKADREVFAASFPNYSVDLSEAHNTWGSPAFVLRIYNSDGDVVEWISSRTLASELPASDKDYEKIMEELYKLARRSALKSDQAVDELISVLEH
jgi:hypothetical protein